MSSSPPPGPSPADPDHGRPAAGEILEQGRGGPLPPADASGSGGRRRLLWAGGAVAGVALVGGAAFGASWYLGSGPQAAVALPAGTLAYASLDLDPSGEQSLEARETLRKFPVLEERLDLGGDLSEIDVTRRLVELALGEAGCDAVDYDRDVDPWLGDRAAVAAVDLGGEAPTAVGVVAVTDADAAEAGLAELATCSGGEAPGVEVSGDWAVVAETDDLAGAVVAAAEEGSLADDEDYRRWTEAAGGGGVLTMYAAPGAGDHLAENLQGLFPSEVSAGGDGLPGELRRALEDFAGMAAALRFADGAVEVEVAGDAAAAGVEALYLGDRGGDAVASLPVDTAAAFGTGFAEGWFEALVANASRGSGMEPDELVAEMEAGTGLQLPEDAEALAGEAAVLAVGGDVDAETFLGSDDGSDVPVGLKVLGDPEAVERVLDQLRPKMGPQHGLLSTSAEGDRVAIGPNEDYRRELLEDGDLGGSEKFQRVVPEAGDAASVLYVDVDRVVSLVFDGLAGAGAVDGSATEVAAVRENLEPLSALGISGWEDDGVAHGLVRLTTD